MDYKLLMDTAVLAGENMLRSGAEIYRVENTMNHILKMANLKTTEAFVLSTGLIATLADPSIQAITVVRRVDERATNLNRIFLVNDISRKFCAGELELKEAHDRIAKVGQISIYRQRWKKASIIGVTAFFTLLMGGSWLDTIAAGVVGLFLAGVLWTGDRLRLNDFCKNALGAFGIAVAALGIKQWTGGGIDQDLVIIGSIMPLVPGVTFTTAIRDTLNGDYSAGIAKMVEAVIIALAVAVGIGTGMMAYQQIIGGSWLW